MTLKCDNNADKVGAPSCTLCLFCVAVKGYDPRPQLVFSQQRAMGACNLSFVLF